MRKFLTGILLIMMPFLLVAARRSGGNARAIQTMNGRRRFTVEWLAEDVRIAQAKL